MLDSPWDPEVLCGKPLEYDPWKDGPHIYMTDHPEYEWDYVCLTKGKAVEQLRALVASKSYDLFFNLCDGAWDDEFVGVEVVRALETMNVPYTGPDASFFDPPKDMMRLAAVSEGVTIPPFVVAKDEDDIEEADRILHYPLLVKHPNGHSSLGLTRESKVKNVEELRTQVLRMFELYHGALIEEFIEGGELTCLVTENPDDPFDPITYIPVQVMFPSGESFKHYELKFLKDDQLQWSLVEDNALAQKARDFSRRVYLAMKGVSFARCDFRVNEETGELYFLEINPNCGMFFSSTLYGSGDFILTFDPEGHRGFIMNVISAALMRHKRKQAKSLVKLRYRADKGRYGLFAAKDIETDSVVLSGEDESHRIVSRAFVMKHWDASRRRHLLSQLSPLGEGLHEVPGSSVESFHPVSHSCDPNSWFAGDGTLDIVARRPIQKGEEITVDYATLYGGDLEEFECDCGSKLCRHVISRIDCRISKLREEYDSHLSPFVRSLGVSSGASV